MDNINIEGCLVPICLYVVQDIDGNFCSCKPEMSFFTAVYLSVLHSPVAGTSRCYCDMNIDHHHNLGIESTYMHTNIVSISKMHILTTHRGYGICIYYFGQCWPTTRVHCRAVCTHHVGQCIKIP